MKRVNKTYYRMDLEDPNRRIERVTLHDLVDQLMGDGTGPVQWTIRNIDYHRVAEEWREIGYELLIKEDGIMRSYLSGEVIR